MPDLQTAEHLRVALAAQLTHYFNKRAETLALFRRARRGGVPPPAFTLDHAVYHSWMPGFIDVDADTAAAIRQWREEGGAAPPLPAAVERALSASGWCIAHATPQLDLLLEKAFAVFPALQNPKELRRFLDEVAERRPRTVVEIGTAAGGVLYCLCQLAHPEALVVTVDMPNGPYGGGQDDEECALFSTFGGARQRIAFIRDRSFHYSTKLDLARLLDGRPIDLLMIDGDHSYAGTKSDFEMYGQFVAQDGLIAFHDILMLPEMWGRGFDVGIVWRELAAVHETREIVDTDAPRRPLTPDVLERFGTPALGFGLLVGRR
jgi:predicted O-methyltransferase YrrM